MTLLRDFLKQNASNLPAEKIFELLTYENDQIVNQQIRQSDCERENERRKKLIAPYLDEIKRIESEITAKTILSPEFFDFLREPDLNHPFLGYSIPGIEEHLKSLPVVDALRFLVECKIKFPYDKDGNFLNNDYIHRMQEKYLMQGEIRKYVEIKRSFYHAHNFTFKIDRLIREYKERSAIPEIAISSHGTAEPGIEHPAGGKRKFQDVTKIIVSGLSFTISYGDNRTDTIYSKDFPKCGKNLKKPSPRWTQILHALTKEQRDFTEKERFNINESFRLYFEDNSIQVIDSHNTINPSLAILVPKYSKTR